ncbi:hypothetical protein JAAARDRAFT_94147, partial [Jaapia argillacea MUCL 33604]
PAADIRIPRTLSRPITREVNRQAVIAAAPKVAHLTTEFIIKALRADGRGMNLRKDDVLVHPGELSATNPLPQRLDVRIVEDILPILPSHILAIRTNSYHLPPSLQNRVLLIPTHHVVIAANCTNIILPPSQLPIPHSVATFSKDRYRHLITIPLIPFNIPSPETYRTLQDFLYSHDRELFLRDIYPHTHPLPAKLLGPPHPSHHHAIAKELAKVCTIHTLAKAILTINGIWRNMWTLGVVDDEMWMVVDTAWESAILAVLILTHK